MIRSNPILLKYVMFNRMWRAQMTQDPDGHQKPTPPKIRLAQSVTDQMRILWTLEVDLNLLPINEWILFIYCGRPFFFHFFERKHFLIFSTQVYRPPGLNTLTPGNRNALFGWSTASNPGHNSTWRPPIWCGREQKRAKFWAVRRRAVRERAVRVRGKKQSSTKKRWINGCLTYGMVKRWPTFFGEERGNFIDVGLAWHIGWSKGCLPVVFLFFFLSVCLCLFLSFSFYLSSFWKMENVMQKKKTEKRNRKKRASHFYLWRVKFHWWWSHEIPRRLLRRWHPHRLVRQCRVVMWHGHVPKRRWTHDERIVAAGLIHDDGHGDCSTRFKKLRVDCGVNLDFSQYSAYMDLEKQVRKRALLHMRGCFDQQRNQATSTLACNMLGTTRAFATAKARKKFAVSGDQRPPTSPNRPRPLHPRVQVESTPSVGVRTWWQRHCDWLRLPLQCRPDARLKPELCRWPTGPHLTVTTHLPRPADDGHRSDWALGDPNPARTRSLTPAPPLRHGDGTLDGKPTSPQHPCNRASWPVVAKVVEWTATPAVAGRQGEGGGRAAHGKGTRTWWVAKSGSRGEWPSLGPNQNTLRRWQCGQCPTQRQFSHGVRRKMLPTQAWLERIASFLQKPEGGLLDQLEPAGQHAAQTQSTFTQGQRYRGIQRE